jgi:Type II secretory pathway, ATPase PulE/Tfp pilus assembly pathway, ATPase PilB
MANGLVETEIAKDAAASTARLIDTIIEEAHNLRASDIHIDPQNGNVRVRYRIDGRLADFHFLPLRFCPEIISRIKILAGLRTDEHQIPQDGRFRVIIGALPLDIRVSVAPTYGGENAVLRLLSDKAEQFALESLGFSPQNFEKIKSAINRPHGMILAAGPTGSGKTTTLYALLKKLNTQDVSIVTIEDPVEYAIGGVRQIQTNSRAGLTFASGLRGILRQDPDIIMVGEIRDAETAGIAVNAALTGHLLLSTLHTNDAATTLPRLLDMKAESYLIASTVNVVIAQRLARRICPHCKTKYPAGGAAIAGLRRAFNTIDFSRQENFWRGAGCNQCAGSGFLGRVGIHEVLSVSSAIKEAILNKSSAETIRRIAIEEGMTTIAEDGFAKAESGITSVEEILRIFHE